MSAAKRATWSDGQVANLIIAETLATVARSGVPGFERTRALLKEWEDARMTFLEITNVRSPRRGAKRVALRHMSQRIRSAPVDWKAYAAATKDRPGRAVAS
jgi:hypothetical protein